MCEIISHSTPVFDYEPNSLKLKNEQFDYLLCQNDNLFVVVNDMSTKVDFDDSTTRTWYSPLPDHTDKINNERAL